jgi:hypothetical protein
VICLLTVIFAQSKSNSKWQMAEMNSKRKPLFNFIRISSNENFHHFRYEKEQN